VSTLTEKKCKACEGGVSPLGAERVLEMVRDVPDWQVDDTGVQAISRIFEFKNYYQTMAFVNLIAWVAHQTHHHPELEVGYNRCVVRYSTHAIDGLSENDFICAAKIDRLFISQ